MKGCITVMTDSNKSTLGSIKYVAITSADVNLKSLSSVSPTEGKVWEQNIYKIFSDNVQPVEMRVLWTLNQLCYKYIIFFLILGVFLALFIVFWCRIFNFVFLFYECSNIWALIIIMPKQLMFKYVILNLSQTYNYFLNRNTCLFRLS